MAGDLGRFNSTLVYESQGSAEQLLADLQHIREFDKNSEVRLGKYRTITWVSVLVTFVGFLLAIFLKQPLVLALSGVGLLGAILGGISWARGAKFDLANKRYELFGEMVKLLGRDMSKDATLKARLDLGRANLSNKKVSQGTAGPWKVTYYVDPWLQLEGRFADGTSYLVTVTEKFQARGKWKRSRSGKNKYKTKTKTATLSSVRFFPKQKRYENLAQVTDMAQGMLRLPPWVLLKDLEATVDELSVSATTTVDWGVRRLDPKTPFDAVQMMAMMMLSLYQILHRSNALTGR